MFCINQRTIKREVEIQGIGLHSGQPVRLKLIPSQADEGIHFVRNGTVIPANIEYAKGFDFSTTLIKDGVAVRTVEHLLAALYFTGIDNITIEIDAEEVPILDGSAVQFIEAIKDAGIDIMKAEKIYAVLNKEVTVKDDDKYITGKPSNSFSATYHAYYNNRIIGNKKYTYSNLKSDYENVAMARTYCFLEEVELLQQMGLAKGGSLNNAVVFTEDSVLNPEGLRFEDEPVKHKVLDLIGDLYLLGFPVIGDIYSFKGGHKLNAEFVKKLLEEKAFDLKYSTELDFNDVKLVA
ncbi:UDP-3-O-[3-hydroxymyristoyl] N-acetylglucosamine deacetylase [Persephonella hydrogeniphila]|uniref:UDP-3-O-acyl-N-acetylglucosamine deacetylase n=1 Tax=Persephonella hydrogeniphila TaxID=198703 RepID=A0A285N3F4_9AQUI|nr:UDP-3-O-acyl-N-acetylglucosamine deacetylase [Persephonella hydrogeniphila]SNZ03357.1 UDP-3-O-[3-hydroxymyristoyl] N-acetylglucosamine deacetylase [Persephonella hydrogeniphila]